MIEIPSNSDFSSNNLPFGIFSTATTKARIGVALGNHIIDLKALSQYHQFDFDTSVFEQNVLNDFIALGKEKTTQVRRTIQEWIGESTSILYQKDDVFVLQTDATMHLPVRVGDYTDFYSSKEHATNVGKMFRDPDNALLPNWKHIPVGYHGRASSIIPSGQPIIRPQGQILPKDQSHPVFQPTQRLDFELEMAFIIGKESKLGQPISTSEAEDYIFGMVIFNDWSARDIQKWEYVPLGPFLGKNFASSISPWVVPLEALDPFRVQGPKQAPEVLPYLQYKGSKNYDLSLEVSITPEDAEETVVSHSNFKYMYWNMVQQLAHHTVNGCNVRVGDLLASGTISGKDKRSYGSMLELSWAGTQPVLLNDGTSRKFLLDGDTVTMRAYGEKDTIRVGFGHVSTKILPSS
ncbi:MAG: fumarylacetoacetase [Flavobacteriaceae bacterium]